METNMHSQNKKDSEFQSIQREFATLLYQFAVIKNIYEARKYDPNQPRVPSGSSGAGQWTNDGSRSIISRENQDNDGSVQLAARRSQAFCDAQYARDLFQCKIVKIRNCYAQAMVRLTACERGQQIPPLNY
jgi:hypothetical protein